MQVLNLDQPMTEVESAPRPKRRNRGQRMISFLVNGLHGVGAIAAAFLTAAFVTLNLLKVFNVADSTSRWLFFGLLLLLAILFTLLYTFGVGAVLDRLGLTSRRLTKQERD